MIFIGKTQISFILAESVGGEFFLYFADDVLFFAEVVFDVDFSCEGLYFLYFFYSIMGSNFGLEHEFMCVSNLVDVRLYFVFFQ